VIGMDDAAGEIEPERVLPDPDDPAVIYKQMLREIALHGQDAFDEKYSQGDWADDHASNN